ncbi:MAG TPA: sigma-70 family RNA polymerase sigma factor [Gemmataceae bacterium]|jgi:RNA polymerase sigma-70 factor (ECF subfamily)|nr:sigma-70 family RNA polymerase sigma factor [Gemmataceae bacterium]
MSPAAACDPERLLPLARAGNAQALGQLLELYRNYLKLLARVQFGRRLQGKADPSDIVQEAFLGAYRDFAGFRGTSETELLSWLRKILATTLAGLARRYYGTRRRDPSLERQLYGELDQSSQSLTNSLVAPHSSPSQQAARREQAVLLADALGQLSEDHREVIVLRQLEGLTFPEVAVRMGRSSEAVKKLWVRALASLRRVLGGLS